ncbi:MAG TPA: cytochrome c oxidase assembly factor Coa1 family protein [Pyrinomonadaceae bacterium]|nr:cytochrome c oxidase assembly factor Coa1 family protein [Pyrinomonadaceae bacterium]
MTKKRILLIVGAVVVALALLVGVFVGGIILFTLYSFGTSDAAVTAKEFLRNNDQLTQDIGDVRDFGTFVSGNVSVKNGNGTATLGLKVFGEKKTVNSTVELVYASGRPWRVTSASYRDEAGKTVDLLNPYESHLLPPQWSVV